MRGKGTLSKNNLFSEKTIFQNVQMLMTSKCDTMLNLGNCYGLSSKKEPPKF